MHVFNYSKLKRMKFDSDIIDLLVSIYTAKTRQENYFLKKPQELDRLVEISKIQSIEASNAIEGIRTSDSRLKNISLDKITPKSRNEEEISGYRDALKTVHEGYSFIPIEPNYILQLHKIMYKPVNKAYFGGKYKNEQNYIQELDDNKKPYIIFTPLAPFETPIAIEKMCREYDKAIKESKVDPLILIPVFIHDFLCAHPFIDGNGRMSRLLTTLLLYKSGFNIVRYISLENKILNIKDCYYEALKESGVGWHENTEDPTPFIKFMLSIIDMAYRDFEDRLDLIDNNKNANELVEEAVSKRIGKIKKIDIMELCPLLSKSAIEKGLAKLIKENKLVKCGIGKSTYYLNKI